MPTPPTSAAARLYQLVRDFAVRTPGGRQALRVRTTPGDVTDMSRVSQRAYGRRSEVLVIQAAAGLDSPEAPLPEQTLTLPDPALLVAMKARAGYVG